MWLIHITKWPLYNGFWFRIENMWYFVVRSSYNQWIHLFKNLEFLKLNYWPANLMRSILIEEEWAQVLSLWEYITQDSRRFLKIDIICLICYFLLFIVYFQCLCQVSFSWKWEYDFVLTSLMRPQIIWDLWTICQNLFVCRHAPI